MMVATSGDTRYNPPPPRMRVPLYPRPWSARALATHVADFLRDRRRPETLCEEVRERLAQRLGIDRNAIILTSSGTEALCEGLKAIKRADGDEVIVSSFVCPSVAEAILAAGMRPVLCDIGAGYNLDVHTVERVMGPRTRAVIAAHIFGTPIDIAALSQLCTERGVHLIDDAAQSLGAEVDGRPLGTWGTFGVLSFGRHKPLFAYGDQS